MTWRQKPDTCTCCVIIGLRAKCVHAKCHHSQKNSRVQTSVCVQRCDKNCTVDICTCCFIWLCWLPGASCHFSLQPLEVHYDCVNKYCFVQWTFKGLQVIQYNIYELVFDKTHWCVDINGTSDPIIRLSAHSYYTVNTTLTDAAIQVLDFT